MEGLFIIIVLYALAFVAFLLAMIAVPEAPRLRWVPAGLLLWLIATLVAGHLGGR